VICSNEEIRGAIGFLFEDGVKIAKIFRRIQSQYGNNFLSCSKIC